MLVNRIDTQILRDPYTQATKGLIRFIARRRVGGKVILPEAIKTMTLHG
jgi:HK97 family phage major capsid protein